MLASNEDGTEDNKGDVEKISSLMDEKEIHEEKKEGKKKRKRTEGEKKSDAKYRAKMKAENEEETKSEQEWELIFFLEGHPNSFNNLLTDLISKCHRNLITKDPSYKNVDSLHEVTDIAYRQAMNRIIFSELKSRGLDYSKLPKLLGSCQNLDTLKQGENCDWKQFLDEYRKIIGTLKGGYYPWECQNYCCSQWENCRSEGLLTYPKIVQNHKEFLLMLHRRFEISFDVWIICCILSFESNGLYIPFNTPKEIIECARFNDERLAKRGDSLINYKQQVNTVAKTLDKLGSSINILKDKIERIQNSLTLASRGQSDNHSNEIPDGIRGYLASIHSTKVYGKYNKKCW